MVSYCSYGCGGQLGQIHSFHLIKLSHGLCQHTTSLASALREPFLLFLMRQIYYEMNTGHIYVLLALRQKLDGVELVVSNSSYASKCFDLRVNCVLQNADSLPAKAPL